ncbi:MAG: hypothetical protein ACREKL_16845 [Chthoniobacterales bacterium]
MTLRATLVLLACALATVHADPTDTYQRSQAFSDGPPKNWSTFHLNQGFGFFPTSSNGSGEAGGFFFPKPYTAYYADTALNGAFNRGTPLSASGTIRLDEVSFDPNYTNTVYLAHFRKGSTADMFVNILGISLTGNNSGAILCAPIVQFSNGRAFLGNSIKLSVDSTPSNWSYQWNPNGGGNQLGQLTVTVGTQTSTLTLNRLSGGIDYTLDSFGLYQPAFVAPNSNSYFTFFVDRLVYTAFVGAAPKIHVKGSKKITTSSASVAFTGTTDASLGNRVDAVRYRVTHNGKTKHYKNASGTSRWNATVSIPVGTSTVEFKAVGDNGRDATKQITVTRTP